LAKKASLPAALYQYAFYGFTFLDYIGKKGVYKNLDTGSSSISKAASL
jgi:hypothetical protein